MPLAKTYPEGFERIWNCYPKWPKGRSVKTDAFKAFQSVQKDLGTFTPEDIDGIVRAIDKQRADRASWQAGHPHGPQGLQRWLRVHGWYADYETVKDTRPNVAAHRQFETVEEVFQAEFNPKVVEELQKLKRALH